MLILLFLFWWLLCGTLTVEYTIVGAVLSIALYAFMLAFTDLTPKLEWQVICRLPGILSYFVYLLIEIVKSAWATMRLVWTGKYVCEEKLVTVKTSLKTNIARTMLCNSITLTPGTVTVDVVGDTLLVHCLDSDFCEGLAVEMERRLLALEGGSPE